MDYHPLTTPADDADDPSLVARVASRLRRSREDEPEPDAARLDVERDVAEARLVVGSLVAGAAGLAVGVGGMAAALWMYFNLATTETLVYVADPVTGEFQQLVRLGEPVALDPSEARDRTDLTEFVHLAERYRWMTLDEDFQHVGYLAGPDVAAAYKARFEGPGALQTTLGDGFRKDVKITALDLGGRGQATVRFTVTTSPIIRGGRAVAPDRGVTKKRFVATIGYQYVPGRVAVPVEDMHMADANGFTVWEYNVGPEWGDVEVVR